MFGKKRIFFWADKDVFPRFAFVDFTLSKKNE